jgi:hypothetical protein
MRHARGPRILLAALWIAGSGCTTLREIPPSDYAAKEERKHVRVETREGLQYEFDYMRVEGDSLVGFRRREVEGSFDEFATMSMAFESVAKLSSRGVDWYRTGLVGGSVLAAVLVAGLSAALAADEGDSDGGTGKPPDPR